MSLKMVQIQCEEDDTNQNDKLRSGFLWQALPRLPLRQHATRHTPHARGLGQEIYWGWDKRAKGHVGVGT